MLRGPYVLINQLIKSIWKVTHLKIYIFYMLKGIVVTYAQFDSNIRVLYVFLGFLKNTPKIRKVVKVMQITITGPQKLLFARLYSS
jgi:hypothetical protein